MRLGLTVVAALFAISMSPSGLAASERLHIERDDFAMNSLGGDDFRRYVSEQSEI